MRKRLLHIISFILSFTGILLFCEIYIFNAGISRKSEVEFSETLGKNYRPNYNYIWFSEGYSMGSVNKHGFLGPGYSIKKPNYVKRIALLGDSYVEGFQVFNRNHFRTILERELNRNGSDSVEVLNFGRSNFNLPNMYAYQKLLVDKFKPDLIFYFLSEEDLTSQETDPLLPNTDPTTLNPMPYLNPEGLNKFLKANAVLKNSALAYMLNTARRKAQENHWAHTVFDGKFDITLPAKQLPEVTVLQLNQDILNHLDPNKVIIVYREKKKLAQNCLNAVHKSELRFLDLSNFLLRLEEKGNNPNYWPVQKIEGHWNIEGHRAVGIKLARFIEK